jgi:hypothetical protein
MSRTKPVLMAATAALLIAGCGSSHKTAVPPPITTPPPATSVPSGATSATTAPAPATTAPATTAAATGGLSGTWTGQYSGAYSGTFTLNWQQSGSSLSGTINLSTAGTTGVHGTVSGGSIQFGTVGNQNITYTGSVSGGSMSGNYQIHQPAGTSNGTWSASKG